jgi:hypothetical protein
VTVKKRQLDDYWWVVQRCLVEFHDWAPEHALETVLHFRAIMAPGVEEKVYFITAWQIAGSIADGKKSLTPQELDTYNRILNETFGEDLV